TGSTAAGLGAAALCLASPALSEWSAYSGPDPLAQALALGAALSLCARRPALAGVLGGLCVATRPEYALLALPLCLLRPRFGVAAARSDVFHELAPALRSGGPLVTAAPDAYGVLLSRPVRFLRPGARGLIVLDAAQRAYQPHVEYRGTIVFSLADRRGFVRPDG